MPKAEKGSLKDLGKRIKAKGLQKLRFWCEMCQKQCRDANGFKCHLQSESHLRQMKLFSENAGGIVNQKSREFESLFLETLRLRHSTATVNANHVYQEVIRDKTHVHMNATMWATLSDFVQYLGKHGKCVVEENERGWFVTYIDRDVGKLAKQLQHQERVAADQAAEAAYAAQLEQQRRAAAAVDQFAADSKQASKLERNETDVVRLTLNTSINSNKKTNKKNSAKPSVFGSDDEEDGDDNAPPGPPLLAALQPPSLPQTAAFNKRKSLDEQPPKEGNPNKKRKETHDTELPKTKDEDKSNDGLGWLYRDIVVRIVDPDHLHYKRKAVVERVPKQKSETAVVTLLGDDKNTAAKELRISPSHLETVVPKQIGRDGDRVRILKGPYRGKKAFVVDLNKKKYRAVLELKDGTRLEKVDFDEFSLLAQVSE